MTRNPRPVAVLKAGNGVGAAALGGVWTQELFSSAAPETSAFSKPRQGMQGGRPAAGAA
jgi:hypothetical protein